MGCLPASAKLQAPTIQIVFNLCFALPIISLRSCMANRNEWGLQWGLDSLVEEKAMT
jgi:hypothetical protein